MPYRIYMGEAILLSRGEWTMTADKHRAHAPADRVPADPMTAAVRFLEFLLLDPVNRALATAPVEDEEISEEEEQAVARSKEWFQHNEAFPSFGRVATDPGFA